MNTIATGQNSPNCQEEDLINPVADNYFSHESIYSLCQEEAVNMVYGKNQISNYWLGKHRSDETKKKISESHKGRPSVRMGKKLSEELKKRISESKKGSIPWNKGKKNVYSEDVLKQWAKVRKGRSPPNKGIPLSDETRGKLSKALIGKLAGDKHPMWKGGVSFEPYCPKFNGQLKEQIRERDNRTCQLCGEKENGQKLDVHHIHYDKENCHPDLITLCRKCNVIVNSNCDYYENLFMENLKQRGYICIK